MGFIEMEKWPQATIAGLLLTFTTSATLPYLSWEAESDKKIYHAQHLHAPGTSLAASAYSCSSVDLVAGPDHLEYARRAVSARIAIDLTFIAKQPFLFPPKV